MASQAASAEIEKDVERQKKLVSKAENVKKDALNDVANLLEWVATASTHEVKFLSNASAASGLMARSTAELDQARDTMSTSSKELAKVALLKSSIRRIEHNVTLHEASAEELKTELVVPINDNTRLRQLVDDIRAEVVDLRERLKANDGVIRSTIDESCALLGPYLRGLADRFRAGLKSRWLKLFVRVPWALNSMTILPSIVSLLVSPEARRHMTVTVPLKARTLLIRPLTLKSFNCSKIFLSGHLR